MQLRENETSEDYRKNYVKQLIFFTQSIWKNRAMSSSEKFHRIDPVFKIVLYL